MKPAFWSGLLGLFVSLPALAAEVPAPAETTAPTTAEILSIFADTKDTVASDWSDLSGDSQAWSKFTKEGYAAVRCEGRVKDGADQYQKVFKKKPPGVSFWCRTAETEDAHRLNDANLRKKGYVLMRVQAFLDTKGVARFQGLWVKVADAPTDAAG